jgi:hypothetical protein
MSDTKGRFGNFFSIVGLLEVDTNKRKQRHSHRCKMGGIDERIS